MHDVRAVGWMAMLLGMLSWGAPAEAGGVGDAIEQAAEFDVWKGSDAALLARIAAQVPDGLRLRSIEQAGQEVTLSGTAPDEEVVAAFLADLEGSVGFDSVVRVEDEASGGDDAPAGAFRMTLRLLLPPVEDGLDELVADPERRNSRTLELLRRAPPVSDFEEEAARRRLEHLVGKAGLTLVEWTPLPAMPVGTWVHARARLEVEGSPSGVLTLFDRLSKLHNPEISRDIQVVVVEGASPIRVRLTATHASLAARAAGALVGPPASAVQGPSTPPYPALETADYEAVDRAFGVVPAE